MQKWGLRVIKNLTDGLKILYDIIYEYELTSW